ncbi:MAG: hypothetical protein JRC93_02925 [Deltaproteobacteria bacterium]|nr:hypothetical protein [Deltaproteobacteria bacterium]
MTLRKKLQQRLEAEGNHFEWSEIKQDPSACIAQAGLKSLQEIVVEDNGKTLASQYEVNVRVSAERFFSLSVVPRSFSGHICARYRTTIFLQLLKMGLSIDLQTPQFVQFHISLFTSFLNEG